MTFKLINDRVFGSKRFGLSEEIPRVVSHSPELTVDYWCVALSVNMLFLD